MPIKTVICNICNEEKTKRKTTTWKNGRACKDHPEVLEAKQEAEDIEKVRSELLKFTAKLAAKAMIVDSYERGWTKEFTIMQFKTAAMAYKQEVPVTEARIDAIVSEFYTLYEELGPHTDESVAKLRQEVHRINAMMSETIPEDGQ